MNNLIVKLDVYFCSMVNWDRLGKLIGKPIKTSYWIWVIGLPLLSVLSIKIREFIAIYYDINIDFVEIPYSWKIIYFSIILIITSNKIYGISCPNLVLNCKSYNDFINSSIALNDIEIYLIGHTLKVFDFQKNGLDELHSKYKVAYDVASKSRCCAFFLIFFLYTLGSIGFLFQFFKGVLYVISA